MSLHPPQSVAHHSTEQKSQETQPNGQSAQPRPRRKPRRPRRKGVPDDQDGPESSQGSHDQSSVPQQGGSQSKPKVASSNRNQPKVDRQDPRFIPRGMFFQHDDRAGVTNATVSSPPVIRPPVEEKKVPPARKSTPRQKLQDEPKWQHDRFQPEAQSESSPKNSSGSRGGRGRGGRGRGSRRGKATAAADTPSASADSSVPVVHISLDSHQPTSSTDSVAQTALPTESSRGRRRGGRGRRKASSSAQAQSASQDDRAQSNSSAHASGKNAQRRERRREQSQAPKSGPSNSASSQSQSVSSSVQSKPSSQSTTTTHSPVTQPTPVRSSAPRPYTSNAVPSVALVLGEDIPPHNFNAVSQKPPQQRRPPLTGHRAQRPSRPGASNASTAANGTSSATPSPPPVASGSSVTNLNPNAKEFVSHTSPGPMHASPDEGMDSNGVMDSDGMMDPNGPMDPNMMDPNGMMDANGMMDPMMAQFFQPVGAHAASPPHAALPTFIYGPYGYVQASPPPLSISPVQPFQGYDGVGMMDVGMQGMSLDPNYPQPYLPYPQDPYGYGGNVSPPPVSMMPMMPQPYGMSQPMYMMGPEDGINPGLSYMGQGEQLSPNAQMGYALPMAGPVVPTPSPPALSGQSYIQPSIPPASGRPDSRVQPLPATVAGRKKPQRFVGAE